MTPKEYLDSINHLEFDDLDEYMRIYARDNNIPIIQDEGLALLRQIVKIANPKKILEIGTAIGYSSIQMARSSNAIIKTIELNEELYKTACVNIEKANLKDRIIPILGDALTIDVDEDFDFLFIDAAKAQYRKFFERFGSLVNKGGIILTDNLVFHGLITEEIQSRSLRGLVRKIREYNEWLVKNEDYETYIYQIGDGVAISIKK